MNLTKLIIICSALSASEGLAQIITAQPPNSDESETLVNTTVDILLSCYEKDVNTVGLAGISESSLLKTLSSKKLIPVTLIGNDTKYVNNGPVDRKSSRKLQIFAITASSSKQLKKILRQVKSTLWWYHMATFLLLDWQCSTKHECSNAFKFLWAAWEMNLLKAVYVCLNRTKEVLIYSYNPYTSQAPVPWQLENTYKGKNDHPWTMFVRKYGGGEQICENLEFHKTNDLGGYEIYASVKNTPTHSFAIQNGSNANCGIEPFEESLFDALNATPRLIVHDITEGPGLSDSKGNDVAMDTVNGISDILLMGRFNFIAANFTCSVAYINDGLSVLTQYRGHASQLDKIITVFDRSTRIGLCLVAVGMVIFFKCLRQETLSTAILNVVRIISNSSLSKVPTNRGARIYLAGVFIVVVTILGVYQGKLSSLLTKSKPLANVETMQDLADLGYTIHGHKTYAHFFSDPVFKGRYVRHEDYNCTKYVLRDSLAACVLYRNFLINETTNSELHLSSDIIVKMFAVYVIRDDWPIEERFNMILTARSEAGLARYLYFDKFENTLRVNNFYSTLEENKTFRVIHLSEMGFSFAILGIGLVCATVCFIVEISIKQVRSRTWNVCTRIQSGLKLK